MMRLLSNGQEQWEWEGVRQIPRPVSGSEHRDSTVESPRELLLGHLSRKKGWS